MSAATSDTAIAICVPDNCGRLIGKRQPATRLPEALGRGMAMPNFHLVTGLDNKPHAGFAVTGPHAGFPNGRLRADPDSRFVVPGEPATGYYIADALDAAGNPVEEAPRAMLRRQLGRLKAAGLSALMASELEFYLLAQSYPEAARADYRGLEPFHHRHGDNDLLVIGRADGFIEAIVADLAQAGLAVDQVQGEGGTGQLEVNIAPAEPLKACDQHAVFKHVVKARAHLTGRAVTFMAKPFEAEAGSGGHIHLCLRDADSRTLLREDETPSGPAAHFIAGVLAYTGDLMILHLPYANSYRRMRAGSFVPLNCGWGWDNRSCLVRLTGEGAAARLEFRIPGADANPYFSYAGLLAAGLAGIEAELALPAPVAGDAGEASLPLLPRDLTEALIRFESSQVARAALGEAVHRHLTGLARAELEIERGHVTDWDLRRGFEVA